MISCCCTTAESTDVVQASLAHKEGSKLTDPDIVGFSGHLDELSLSQLSYVNDKNNHLLNCKAHI